MAFRREQRGDAGGIAGGQRGFEASEPLGDGVACPVGEALFHHDRGGVIHGGFASTCCGKERGIGPEALFRRLTQERRRTDTIGKAQRISGRPPLVLLSSAPTRGAYAGMASNT